MARTREVVPATRDHGHVLRYGSDYPSGGQAQNRSSEPARLRLLADARDHGGTPGTNLRPYSRASPGRRLAEGVRKAHARTDRVTDPATSRARRAKGAGERSFCHSGFATHRPAVGQGARLTDPPTDESFGIHASAPKGASLTSASPPADRRRERSSVKPPAHSMRRTLRPEVRACPPSRTRQVMDQQSRIFGKRSGHPTRTAGCRDQQPVVDTVRVMKRRVARRDLAKGFSIQAGVVSRGASFGATRSAVGRANPTQDGGAKNKRRRRKQRDNEGGTKEGRPEQAARRAAADRGGPGG